MQQEKNLFCIYIVILSFQFSINVVYGTAPAPSFIKCVICSLKWRTRGIRGIKTCLPGSGVMRSCLVLPTEYLAWVRKLRPLCLVISEVSWGFAVSCAAPCCARNAIAAQHGPCSPPSTAPCPSCESKSLSVQKITAITPNFFLISYASMPDKFGIWYVKSHSWGKAQIIGFSRPGFYLRHVSTAALCFKLTISWCLTDVWANPWLLTSCN